MALTWLGRRLMKSFVRYLMYLGVYLASRLLILFMRYLWCRVWYKMGGLKINEDISDLEGKKWISGSYIVICGCAGWFAGICFIWSWELYFYCLAFATTMVINKILRVDKPSWYFQYDLKIICLVNVAFASLLFVLRNCLSTTFLI